MYNTMQSLFQCPHDKSCLKLTKATNNVCNFMAKYKPLNIENPYEVRVGSFSLLAISTLRETHFVFLETILLKQI